MDVAQILECIESGPEMFRQLFEEKACAPAIELDVFVWIWSEMRVELTVGQATEVLIWLGIKLDESGKLNVEDFIAAAEGKLE